MRRVLAIVLITMCGCSAEIQERAQEYSLDGLHLYSQGDYRSARESFEAARALRPKDANLLYNIGQCYDRMGDPNKAQQYYAQVLQMDADHQPCRHAMNGLLVRQGKMDEASRLVDDWLRREPKSATALAEDAWLWQQRGDLPRAQARLQQALEINPQEPRALVEMGQVYEKLNRPDRAAVLYEQALLKEPNQPDVKRRLNHLMHNGVTRPRLD